MNLAAFRRSVFIHKLLQKPVTFHSVAETIQIIQD